MAKLIKIQFNESEINKPEIDKELVTLNIEQGSNIVNVVDSVSNNKPVSTKSVWDAFVDFNDLQLKSYLSHGKDIAKIAPNITKIVRTSYDQVIGSLMKDITQEANKQNEKENKKQLAK